LYLFKEALPREAAIGVAALAMLWPAPSLSLTLAEAQRRAVDAAPQVAGAAAGARAAREMAVSAGRRPDPVARIGIENLPVEGPDRFSIGRDFMTMRRLGLMQEYTAEDKLRTRSARFLREAEKVELERMVAIARAQRETAIAWLDRHFAEAIASAVAEQRNESQREVEAAQAAYRAGRVTQAEVLAARAAVVDLDERLIELRSKIAVATANLARWIGPAAGEALSAPPALDEIPGALEHTHLYLQLHPDILAARKAEELAAAEVEAAKANRDPDWTWELAYSRRGSAYGDMVSFGVSVPLPWDRANRQDREVAARLAQAEQAAAQREELVRSHAAEVQAMVHEWHAGRLRLQRLGRELSPLAAERTRAVLAAYRGARSTLGEVLAARRNELEVKVRLLQLERETARLWANLAFLLPATATKEVR
jgi:outer membrane protein TolC